MTKIEYKTRNEKNEEKKAEIKTTENTKIQYQ